MTRPGAYTGAPFSVGHNDTVMLSEAVSGTDFDGGANNDSIALTNTSLTFSTNTIAGGLANDTISVTSTPLLLYGGTSAGTAGDGNDSITLNITNSAFVRQRW